MPKADHQPQTTPPPTPPLPPVPTPTPTPTTPTLPPTTGRANQKLRTRTAILAAATDLAGTGREVTMLDVAKAALVSEATAYRYFPDLASLLQEAMADQMPTPTEAMATATDPLDPVARVAAATEHLLRHVQRYQGAARAMIAATITRPATAAASRPGLRFGLIDHALAPLADAPDRITPAALAQLKNDLAPVVSAEALFCLTDLCGLAPEAAIASAIHTATALTRAALALQADTAAALAAATTAPAATTITEDAITGSTWHEPGPPDQPQFHGPQRTRAT